MSFDQDRYEREVIRPLRSRRGRLSDDDLLRRYAVDPEMSKEELRAHLRRIRTYWNQKSGGAAAVAEVCKQLQIADEELQRRVGTALEDPAWWRQQADRSSQAARAAVEQLTADLTQAYGTVGQVTRAQLERIVAHYPAVQPSQVDTAVQQAGLRVIDAVELPTTSGLDKVAYRDLGTRLREVGAATIVHLLYPDLNRPFTLVREFTVPTGPAVALDATVVDRCIAEMEKAADSPAVRARKAALRILRTGLTAGAELRRLALFQVVEQLATDHVAGLADTLLIRQATRLGLAQADAELVVASLPSGVEAQSAAAARVRDLLADGQLRSAQQALAGVSAADPDRADLEKAIKHQLAEFQQLLAGAEDAVRGQREQEAERLLRAAQRIADDDPDLEARLLRLPIAPPREVTAKAAGPAVRLGWQPPESAAPQVRYLVVRMEGRAPASPQDGTQVGETAATSLTDSAAPAARDLHYGVFATGTGGATWSRAATATTRLVPAVAEVEVHARPQEVTASWQVHPSVVEVRACRTRHRPPAKSADGIRVAAARTSLVDRDIQEGEEYFYGLTAIYHDERRQEVAAPMTVVSALPRAAAKPLSGLAVSPLVAEGDAVRVRLTWPVGAAGQVRIRRAAALPDWEVGEVLAVEQVDGFGTEVPGSPVPEGDWMTLEAEVPVGPQVYVPFTIGGTGAVMGDPVELGQSEPVRQLHARRIAERVVLTWVWPAGVRLVEVEWAAPGQSRQVRRVSHSQYVDGTGCALPVGPGGGTAAVRAITIGQTGESAAAPATVTVPGRAIALSYVLRQPAWRARVSGGSRRRIIEVTADQDCSGIDLAVVVSLGLVMPLSVEQGSVVDRFDGLRLIRDRPVPLEVELPGRLRRPYWIRCFATAPETVTMIDPPIANLKVA